MTHLHDVSTAKKRHELCLFRYIIQKYENALDWIKTSVNNGILPNDYIDLTIKWGHDLGKMSKSVQARRAIDATLAEIKIRQAQETAIQRRGRFQ